MMMMMIVKKWVSSSCASDRRAMSVVAAALWGNGDFGRLGLGTPENTSDNSGGGSVASRWRPAICSGFRESLRSIACGGAHTLFLTESGSVYATGLNDYGQLGISDDRSYSTEPCRIPGLPKEIIQISAGHHHSSAITVDGELYMWGNNSNGQLGLGKKAASVVSTPSKVECLSKVRIKMAALGSEHSVAITDNGEALSWGAGGSGRLGHGHQQSVFGFFMSTSEYVPRLIKKLEGTKIQSIAAGMLHSACIDENGSIFVFGERAVEKLSLGQAKNVSTPSVISELPSFKEVACGGYHTCAITSGGELYAWGSNENGCLGTGGINVGHSPERVQGPFLKHPVSQVSCGWKHTAAISEGHVYAWGWGGSHGTFSEDGHSSGGQLGQGDDVDYIEPRRVDFGEGIMVKALQVSCGFNHTGAIFEYY